MAHPNNNPRVKHTFASKDKEKLRKSVTQKVEKLVSAALKKTG